MPVGSKCLNISTLFFRPNLARSNVSAVSSICWLWCMILGWGMGHMTTMACEGFKVCHQVLDVIPQPENIVSRDVPVVSGPQVVSSPKNVYHSVWPHGFLVGPSNDVFYKATSRSPRHHVDLKALEGILEADAMRWCDEEAVVYVESWCRNELPEVNGWAACHAWLITVLGPGRCATRFDRHSKTGGRNYLMLMASW